MSLIDLASRFPPSIALFLFLILALALLAGLGFKAISQPGLEFDARKLVNARFGKIIAAFFRLVLLLLIVALMAGLRRERPPPEAPKQETPVLLIVGR